MLRSTIAKVASCIGESLFCSRRRTRRPRAAAYSRTAANTWQALAHAIAFLSVSCKAAAVGTTGRKPAIQAGSGGGDGSSCYWDVGGGFGCGPSRNP